MKVDSSAEAFAAAEASGGVFDPLDFGVERLAVSSGREVGQNGGQPVGEDWLPKESILQRRRLGEGRAVIGPSPSAKGAVSFGVQAQFARRGWGRGSFADQHSPGDRFDHIRPSVESTVFGDGVSRRVRAPRDIRASACKRRIGPNDCPRSRS